MPFRPGHSGNPVGRPRGSRNTRTIIAEKLLDDSAGDLTRAVIARALAGDPAALRACLDRVAPPMRHRPLDFALPQLVTLADAPVAINAIAQGLAHGELDVEAAAVLLRTVREFTRALEAVERDKRRREGDDLARQDALPDGEIDHRADQGAALRLPGGELGELRVPVLERDVAEDHARGNRLELAGVERRRRRLRQGRCRRGEPQGRRGGEGRQAAPASWTTRNVRHRHGEPGTPSRLVA